MSETPASCTPWRWIDWMHIQFGVPQGSVLGPPLFVLYTADICHSITQHGLCVHQYADDTQVYGSRTPDNSVAVRQFSGCIETLADWMLSSLLQLHSDKTPWRTTLASPPITCRTTIYWWHSAAHHRDSAWPGRSPGQRHVNSYASHQLMLCCTETNLQHSTLSAKLRCVSSHHVIHSDKGWLL